MPAPISLLVTTEKRDQLAVLLADLQWLYAGRARITARHEGPDSALVPGRHQAAVEIDLPEA